MPIKPLGGKAGKMLFADIVAIRIKELILRAPKSGIFHDATVSEIESKIPDNAAFTIALPGVNGKRFFVTIKQVN